MGKGRRVQVRQVKQKQRTVKVKPPAETSPADQRRQRERYVASGGFFQGYDPEWIVRVGYYAAGGAVLCLLIAVELVFGPLRPVDFPTRLVAALAWVIPIAVMAALIAPAVRLAWLDRKETQLKVVQGQLLGASTVSPSRGLGMVMVKTRAGTEQFLVPAARLAKVPGNVVQVILNMTPRLRHVKTVSIIGPRQVPRPEPPVPPLLRRLQLMPLLTPVAIVVAAILGDDGVAFIPFHPDWAHALAAFLAGALLGGGAFGAFFFYQRRLMAEAQALVPQ